MKLHRVKQALWTIYAIGGNDESCPLRDFLEAAEAGEAKKMYARIAYSAQKGPPRNKEQCRDIGDKIFELKTKDLRVFFFYDKGRVIVCSHGWEKDQQKLDPREKERAIRARTQYFAAKRDGLLEVVAP